MVERTEVKIFSWFKKKKKDMKTNQGFSFFLQKSSPEFFSNSQFCSWSFALLNKNSCTLS